MSRLVLPDMKDKPVIGTECIIGIEADGNSCWFFITDINSPGGWKKKLVTNTLKYYEHLLLGDGILRTNKGQMVNKEFVESISSDHVISMSKSCMGLVTLAEGFRHAFYQHFKS
jgi:hypothetical protein